MIESALLQGAYKITLALVAVIGGWATLRLLDKTSNFDDRIWANPYAPHYFAARFVGVMLVFGLILG